MGVQDVVATMRPHPGTDSSHHRIPNTLPPLRLQDARRLLVPFWTDDRHW